MHRCQECGSDVHEALSPRGLCPSCLLWLGLGRGEDPDDQETLLKPTPPPAPWGGARATLGSGRTFGPYRIERLLGKGGMGEVYEAEHEENGRRVALKILTRGLGDPAERARFLREGRLAASINHPHTVYIYGTEEIEGLPVITMELASGGTLKDRVKEKGPLPPAEAVDVILQVISGLEAASAVEVLHRDVKPSNCFVDGEGRVKVGDFGLSISTLAHSERDVTATGTFLGTPAFASPEQLRCDALDVRSDIYAVGATLYYLLTGRAPFEDANILKLATRIAQEAPAPVRSFRSDVPQGLARVIARCLAKTAADRFESYTTLAAELEPFGSTAPVPARPGLRGAAGVIDWFVLGLLLTPLAIYLQWVAPDASSEGTRIALYVFLGAAYFGLLESRFGASIGKAVCGLRVIDPHGERPRLWRALGRGVLFFLGIQSLNLLSLWMAGIAAMPATLSHPPLYVGLKIGSGYTLDVGLHFEWPVGIVLLFIAARRRNGFAGLHELATGTRVVRKATHEVRAAAQPASVGAPPPANPSSVGSYQVLNDLGGNLVLGYDGRLRRRVWIEHLPDGAAAVPPRRRDLSRPARLHWLNGRRTEEECWDVYEACEGTSLLDLLDEPQPWGTVRYWIRDLAAELAAGLEDRSLPDLGLDRVWVTPEARAKLLDWPAPHSGDGEAATSAVEASAVDLESAQRFLNRVALSALLGSLAPRGSRIEGLSIGPLPLSARSFLQELGRQAFQTPQELVDAAGSVSAGPAVVTRRRRLLHMAICSFVPAVVAVYTAPLVFMVSMWVHRNPDLVELAEGLEEVRRLERLQDASEEARGEDLREMGYEGRDLRELVRTYEVYLAGRHRGPAGDPSTWSQPFIRAEQRALAERTLAAHPNPTDEEVEEARQALTPFFERVVEQHPQLATPLSAKSLDAAAAPLAFLPFVAVPALLSAALFHGGLLFWALGVSIVTPAGTRASRLRAFFRAAIAWAPGLLLGLELLNLPDEFAEGLPLGWFILPWEGAYVLVAASLFVGLVWAIVDPSRGLQDRLAGTCLVPR